MTLSVLFNTYCIHSYQVRYAQSHHLISCYILKHVFDRQRGKECHHVIFQAWICSGEPVAFHTFFTVLKNVDWKTNAQPKS